MSFAKAGRDEAFEDLRMIMERYERPPRDLRDVDWWKSLHVDCQDFYDRHDDPMMKALLLRWASYVEDVVRDRLKNR